MTSSNLRVGSFGTDGTVIYANGDVTGPDGETLRTGDPLCTGENGAGYTFSDGSAFGAPPPTQKPRYDGYFGDVDKNLEQDLKLHVGSDGALWFGIGTFGSSVEHGNCVPGSQMCNIGAGEPLTGGVIDVPAAHINVTGRSQPGDLC
jgi:hypothetical protein